MVLSNVFSKLAKFAFKFVFFFSCCNRVCTIMFSNGNAAVKAKLPAVPTTECGSG